MTKDELLIDRYRVILDYPGSPFFKGQILTQAPPLPHTVFRGLDKNGEFTTSTIVKEEIDKHPAIFRKLHWWEERTDFSCFPGYIKYKSLTTGKDVVWKVENWGIREHFGRCAICFTYDGVDFNVDPSHYLPATEAEYKLYKKIL